MNIQKINFHKRTYFPSSYLAFDFNLHNNEQMYFTSGSKLILYDYVNSKKIFRILTKGEKILCMKQSESEDKILYFLDCENCFYKYNTETKEVLANYALMKSKKFINFYVKQDSIFYILSEDSFLTKLQLIFNDKGTETFKKLSEYQIIKAQKETPLKISKFIIKDNYLIFSSLNILYIHNMLLKETDEIHLQKRVSSILSLQDNSICVGDVAGKMHIISDITSTSYIITTKHWHAHSVNDVIMDPNMDYIYSCGKEGVIVVWNVKTWSKNFIPRLGDEILNLRVSPDSKYMSCFMKNNSIIVISLVNMKIIDVVNSISPECDVKLFSVFNKKENVLSFINRKKGIINFYDIINNTFTFYLNIFNKNYSSKTEKEEKNNLRTLTNISFSSPKNSNDVIYMMTVEHLPYENDLFSECVKFWKVQKDNLELLCLCENPHYNKKISYIEGLNYNKYGFISVAEDEYKIWHLANGKFTCVYKGGYQKRPIKCVSFNNNLVDDRIFVLYDDGRLISYENFSVKKIVTLPGNYALNAMCLINNEYLCLYGKRDLVIVDIDDLEIIVSETVKNDEISKVNYNTKESTLNIFVEKCNNKDYFYMIKYDISLIRTTHSMMLVNALIVEKKNYSFLDSFSKHIIVVNQRKEVFIANEREFQKKAAKKTKKDLDEEDIEI